MGKIDIFIYIFIFLFMLMGYSKGFLKQVLSTANWLVALIGAFAFVNPFTKLMLKTNISTNVNEKVANWISSKGDIFAVPFDPSNNNEQLVKAINEDLKLPKFIANAIAGGFNPPTSGEPTTLADVLAPNIGNVIMTIISFVILFFAILILIKLIIHLLDIVFDEGILGFVNKLFGAGLGLIKAVLIICIAMLIVSALAGVVESLNNFLIKDLRLGQDGTFSIGRYFYESNPLKKLLESTFKNIL